MMGKKKVTKASGAVPEPTPAEEVHIEKVEPQREGKPTAEELVSQASSEETSSTKSLIIMVSVLVGVFALFLGGSYAYNYLTAGNVVDVDDLHKENLQGDLEEEEGYVYNGYSFVKADGMWWTEVTRLGTLVKIPLHFGPREVEEIPIEGKLDGQFNNGPTVYLTIDPEAYGGHYIVAMREISANIGQGINRNSEGACTKNVTGCEDRKILSCENTQGLPVIELAINPTPRIDLSGSCIKISGNQYELIKAADRILYQWYDIMN